MQISDVVWRCRPKHVIEMAVGTAEQWAGHSFDPPHLSSHVVPSKYLLVFLQLPRLPTLSRFSDDYYIIMTNFYIPFPSLPPYLSFLFHSWLSCFTFNLFYFYFHLRIYGDSNTYLISSTLIARPFYS